MPQRPRAQYRIVLNGPSSSSSFSRPSLFEEGSCRRILYGQPSSSSGLTMASLRTSSGGAVAIQMIRDATSAGGNALVTGGGSSPDTARCAEDHVPQWVAI